MGQIQIPSVGAGSSPSFTNLTLTGFETISGSSEPRIVFFPTGADTPLVIDTGIANFPGNFKPDPVLAIGYNVSAQNGVYQIAPDPAAAGAWFEGNYESDSGLGGVATGGNAVSLTDGGKAFAINSLINWTLYNVTTGGRGKITSNTATVLNVAGMVLADLTTVAPPNAAGNVYQILRVDMEDYFQFGFNPGGAGFFGVRPIFYTIDKGTALNETATAKAVTGATATNPMTVTVLGHKLATNLYVSFAAMPGNYAVVNGRQFAVTVIDANTFSININATAFGAYTAGGTIIVQPSFTASTLLAQPQNGLTILLPNWTGTLVADRIATFNAAGLTLFSQNNQQPDLSLVGVPAVNAASLTFLPSGIRTNQLTAFGGGAGGYFRFDLYDAAGANFRQAMEIRMRAGNFPFATFGNDAFNTGLVSVGNNTGDVARTIVATRDAAGQTADAFAAFANDGVTKKFAVTAAGTITSTVFTVATLPAAAAGTSAYVSDALAPAFGAVVAGGGAVFTSVFRNAAAQWIVG